MALVPGTTLPKPTVVAVAKSVSDCTTIKSASVGAVVPGSGTAFWAITESPTVSGVAVFPKKLPAVVTT